MSLSKIITEAIRDIEVYGFDSTERVNKWLELIKLAAEREQVSQSDLLARLRKNFGNKFISIVKPTRDVPAFTLSKIKPHLRSELDRRIMAAADLIKLNKEESMAATLRRFAGWATSLPVGGGIVDDKNGLKKDLKKSIESMSFIERRVVIDQGHKLASNIRDIIAVDGGAVAAMWRSHYKQVNYNFRKDHKERDSKIYLIRDSWADKQGLVKGDYTDSITAPAEEVYCRCYYVYLYNIRKLPAELLTKKGADYVKAK